MVFGTPNILTISVLKDAFIFIFSFCFAKFAPPACNALRHQEGLKSP